MSQLSKKHIVTHLTEIYNSVPIVIVVHYHGLTVSQLYELRSKLRENDAKLQIVKNTLSKIAATNANMTEDYKNILSGPTALIYSSDPVSASKHIVEFAKKNQSLKLIGGLLNNEILDPETIKQFAKLPSLDELRGKIVGLLQAPAAGLLRVLQAPSTSVTRVIKAYADKK